MSFDLSSYQTVEERLREFWTKHPYGRITTDLIAHGDGDYIVKATVWRGDEVGNIPPASTGLAHDAVATLPSNMKASALEVCETSAIGRALANLGFAPKGQRPSREEMQKASPGSTAQADNAGTGPATGGTSSDGGGGAEGVPLGEGPSAAAPPSDALAALLEALGGSEQKAINAVNKACSTAYRKDQLETLEPEDWQAGLALVRGGAK